MALSQNGYGILFGRVKKKLNLKGCPKRGASLKLADLSSSRFSTRLQPVDPIPEPVVILPEMVGLGDMEQESSGDATLPDSQ